MKNCLVTRYKSSVSNNDLLRFGELPIKMDVGSFKINNSTNDTVIRADKASLSLVNGGTGYDSVTVSKASDTTTMTTVYVTQPCTVFVPQYYLNRITIIPQEDINIEFIGANIGIGAYITVDTSTVQKHLGVVPANCRSLNCYLCTFDLSNVEHPNLISLQANSGNTRNSLDVPLIAAVCPELKTMEVPSSNIVGTLEDFGACKNLVTLSFFSGTGTMEGFVAAQRVASGSRPARTTGSISLKWCTKITFQGVNNLVQGTAKTLSWTATTITFDGTTITA